MARWRSAWRCWRGTAVSSSISITSRASTAGSTACRRRSCRPNCRICPLWTKARQDAAKIYDAGLNQIEDVVVPQVAPDRSHVYHLYTIRHPRRDALAAHLNAHGVQTAINYPTALPFLPAYSRLKHRPEQFPNAHTDQGQDFVAADVCGDHAGSTAQRDRHCSGILIRAYPDDHAVSGHDWCGISDNEAVRTSWQDNRLPVYRFLSPANQAIYKASRPSFGTLPMRYLC